MAKILSVSAIRNEGHTLEYENESDSFSLSYSCGQSIFTRRDNGLYVCNFGPSDVFVSRISDLESKYLSNIHRILRGCTMSGSLKGYDCGRCCN